MADQKNTEPITTPFTRWLDFVKTEKDAARLLDIYTRFQEQERNRDRPTYEPNIMPLGRYKGKKIIDVAILDTRYLEWLVKQTYMDRYPEQHQTIKDVLESRRGN
jgi:hypothetical protein